MVVERTRGGRVLRKYRIKGAQARADDVGKGKNAGVDAWQVGATERRQE